MSDLYKKIMSLCEEKGIKGGKMCTDIGISKGILTDLKMGRQTGISTANAQKIAAYFGVSVGYLLGEEEQKNPTTKIDSGISKAKADLIKKVMQMSDEELQKLDLLLRIVESK